MVVQKLPFWTSVLKGSFALTPLGEHKLIRAGHKKWSAHRWLSVETGTMEVSAMEAARRFEKENFLEKVTNREQRQEGSL